MAWGFEGLRFSNSRIHDDSGKFHQIIISSLESVWLELPNIFVEMIRKEFRRGFRDCMKSESFILHFVRYCHSQFQSDRARTDIPFRADDQRAVRAERPYWYFWCHAPKFVCSSAFWKLNILLKNLSTFPVDFFSNSREIVYNIIATRDLLKRTQYTLEKW